MQKIQINGVDIEINVPSQEELTLLKGQLEAAKKVISDLKTANNHLVGDVRYAAQKIKELKKENAALKQQLNEMHAKYAHLQKDMDGTLLAYEDMKETAKENQAACQVLRDQLDEANSSLNAANFAVKYWQDQFRVVADKLQEIKKVLK